MTILLTRNPEKSRLELFSTTTKRASHPLPYEDMTAAHLAAWKISQKHPHMSSRAWKAAHLAADHAVRLEPEPQGHHNAPIAYVRSQSNPEEEYIIGYLRHTGSDLAAPEHEKGHVLSCTCYDYREGFNPKTDGGQPICKHILAFMLHLNTREDRDQWQAELEAFKAQAFVISSPEQDHDDDSIEEVINNPEALDIKKQAAAKARRRDLLAMSREQIAANQQSMNL